MNDASRVALIAGLASALLAACTLGPDYVRPDAPMAAAFVQGEAAPAGDAPAPDLRFWQAFGDARLSALIEQALRNNHDLQAALAHWQQAQALLGGARWEQAPSLGTEASAGRQRLSADQAWPGVDRRDRDEHVYSGSLGLSWELDLFGRLRRGSEAARADGQAAAADLAAAQVAIVGALARSWFELGGLQARLQIARADASAQQRTAEVLQRRLDAGMASAFDLDRARAQLEDTRARVPALEAQEAQAAHRIAVLAGSTPESMAAQLLASAPPVAALPPPPAPGTPAD
ncbi:MAG: TolC family protein, partial [Pseudoxanthomonas sp.]